MSESEADYERRCSFDRPALDLARHLERVFVSLPKRLRVTKAQIAITELLMEKTAIRSRMSFPPHGRVMADGRWLDIASAPKDKKFEIDLWCSDLACRFTDASWINGAWCVWGCDEFKSAGWHRVPGTITHWSRVAPPTPTSSPRRQKRPPHNREGSDGH